MKYQYLAAWLILCLALACEWPEVPGAGSESAGELPVQAFDLEYPATPIDSGRLDAYFGLEVADPYRWLEQTASSEVRRWVGQQDALVEDWLARIPFRDALRRRLRELGAVNYSEAPQRAGGYYYLFQHKGAKRAWYRQRRLGDQSELVLDAADLPSGLRFGRQQPAISPDGVYAAIVFDEDDSEFQHIRVLDLRSKRFLPGRINRVQHCQPAWQGKGFYYTRYSTPQRTETVQRGGAFHQVYYHTPGQDPDSDLYVFGDVSNPSLRFEVQVTEDERFLLIQAQGQRGTALYLRDLRQEEEDYLLLMPESKQRFALVGNVANDLLLYTSADNGRGQVLRVPAGVTDTAYWSVLIPEASDLLEQAWLLGGRLLLHYQQSGASQLQVYNPDGSREDSLYLPSVGRVWAVRGSQNSAQAFVEYSSFYHPSAVYALDMATLEQKLVFQPDLPYDPSPYKTRRVWCRSQDGTRVPLLITHRAGLEADGRRPVLLMAQGALGQSVLPYFHPMHIALLEQGGLLVAADVRGGGGFLSAWHRGGSRGQKQRSIDDLQAAALHLIENGYTQSDRLALAGEGAGALLVGACLVQRPDLFGVALPTDGLYDMLRYQHLEGGRRWSAELGRSDEERSLGWLYAYSPAHQAEPSDYPATLLLAGGEEVSPAHSYKFAAVLQHYQRGRKPILLQKRAAPGDANATLNQAADRLSFMLYQMGLQPGNL
jgi:prolyl oligopeptidase